MKKLKVGLVLDDSLDRADGVQQYVGSLGQWLSSLGHEVHYLAGESAQTDDKIHSLARNVGVRFNANRLRIPLRANSKKIKQLVERSDFDVLHVQMPYSPFMSGKVIQAAQPKTAVVGTFHILPFGKLHQFGSSALGNLQRKTLARFDGVCSVSAPAADFAQEHFGISSNVIPCMIDIAGWQQEIKPHPKRLVFLGRLVERKGCKQLLESLALLPAKQKSGLEILIAGDGPDRNSLVNLANRLNLPTSFLGYIPENQKASLLASAEIAAFPALGGESFGIVLIEAMAAGAGVVIGGDNAGYASVLGEWPETLVDPQKPEKFAKILELFMNDTSLRKRVGDAQHKTVKRYDVHNVGRQILEMYSTALLHRRREMR